MSVSRQRDEARGVTGDWRGWSAYIPIDGYFFEDHEAIYRTEASFKQHGHHVTVSETLTHIYDIHGKHLEQAPPRKFSGKGIIRHKTDIYISFQEQGSMIDGSMQLFLDPHAAELYGILAVRPRRSARPVAVKLLLRRADQAMPTLEEFGIDRIRQLM